ncbi:uncharacterized protein VTP21DRAFT_10439 [Calcarisporiella thermophila]|uniref:uncharacterized protein n=1 Tax=Calcarisporiella thermophila TaxID=911321 RepID=UPI003743A56B
MESHVKSMSSEDWYGHAQSYWNSIDPDVDGMLGGFGRISHIDTQGSLRFLRELTVGKKGAGGHLIKAPCISPQYACDCGAGIGRVTQQMLLKVPFERVDLVEQCEKFIKRARIDLKEQVRDGKVGDFYTCGLQNFVPVEGRYDLIWCQWVLGHLTDDDLITFFQRCKKGLKPGGIIGVKENISSNECLYDEEDSSVTRPDKDFKDIFRKAGLSLIKEETQHGFPDGLFTVRMYALRASD